MPRVTKNSIYKPHGKKPPINPFHFKAPNKPYPLKIPNTKKKPPIHKQDQASSTKSSKFSREKNYSKF